MKMKTNNARTVKKGSNKTVKKMAGGGRFEEDDYNVSINAEEIPIKIMSDRDLSKEVSDASYLGKSTTLLHNIYLQNMIGTIINDVNCSDRLLLFMKALQSIPEKTNYLSKDADTFLHYYIFNELVSKYEGDDIMDCFIVDNEYAVNYSVTNYQFLYNYNLCDLYLKHAFDELTSIITEYNLTNVTTPITQFNDTFQNLYKNPEYRNIYNVNDLKKVIDVLLRNDRDIQTKIKTYFYNVDYRNVKLEEIELRVSNISQLVLTNAMMTKVLSDKSRTISTLLNVINGLVKDSKMMSIPTATQTPTPTPTPSPPVSVITITRDGIIEFFKNLNESSDSQAENPISRAVMYLLTIPEERIIRTELSKFEKMLNIKLDDGATSELIKLINQYQRTIYGSNNSVYTMYIPKLISTGGAKSAQTESAFVKMKQELSTKHVVYDNAHDFDYGIYDGDSPLCKNLCDYSIVTRKDAVAIYEQYYGSKILGTDSTIKSHIYTLTFDKFMPYLATADFNFDAKNQSTTLKSIQQYIRKEILQIGPDDALTKSNVAFCHDMGGMFTDIMIKGKLSLSTDNDQDGDDKKSKDFINFHNSTLLKAWDSSTGGFNIGNEKIKEYVLKSPLNAKTAVIAYNLQALTAMTKYFAIDYYAEIVSLFKSGAINAYIPVLQSNKLNKTEFSVEMFLVNLDVAKEIYQKIKTAYDNTHKTVGADFMKELGSDMFTIEGFLNPNFKKGKIIRLIDNGVRYPVKKYSVNSILKALNLPVNSKRSGNPNKDSITSLENLLDVNVLKSNWVNAISKNKYLFMLKHSGDTCQGIQTGLAADVFNLVLKDAGINFTNTMLYTEDGLAFCNAVFNGNNVMTITAKNNVVSIYHTRNSLSLNSFASSVKKIYDHLISPTTNKSSTTYKSEVAYFNEIINTINTTNKNGSKQPAATPDETIELIKRISDYDDYFSLKTVFDELIKSPNAYGGIIDFGKYEKYFDFNSIYLLSESKDLTGKDLTTNKLRFNKFINTYNSFNQITVKNAESVYKSSNDGQKNREKQITSFDAATGNADTLFYSQFDVMMDDIVANSDSEWIEALFKRILAAFNNDLMEFLYHVQELKEQFKKVTKLKTLADSQDKIHSLLNKPGTPKFNEIINNVIVARLNSYKQELKNEMNYADGKRKNNSTVEFVATTKTVKYNCTFNLFKLITCVRKLKIVGSASLDTIRDIIKQIDEALV